MVSDVYTVNKLGRMAMAGVLVFLISFHATATGYLQTIGPTPIRIQAKLGPNLANLPALNTSDNVNDSQVDTAAALGSRPYYSPVVITTAGMYQAGANLENSLAALQMNNLGELNWNNVMAFENLQTAGNTVSTATSANDLLVVTPQMLVNYFKPNKNSTNGAGSSVLVPVGFNSPGNNPAPPSSQATYLSP